MSLKFKKVKEDFDCGHCGLRVTGNGFTNHCPKCLWSKHVDTFPGDRLAPCQGMMEPVRLEQDKKGFVMTHKCVVCGYEKRNKLSPEDDFDNALRSVKPKD